uniref:Transposase MuDR plant domain-containing protein n=1 Tax=Hordeum vulgare subsp. vulgare TaxID=112509 RepID=A0A8I6YAR4_HORVV
MYYMNEEDIGSGRVKYLGNEASVHEMLEVYHYVKAVNIKVVRDVQPASTQANENYMNTQESCNVKKVVEQSELQKQINDRKAQLERTRIQREADLNHFEDDTQVSEFCSDDSVHSDGSAAEAVQMEIDCASEEDKPLELTTVVKYVKNPSPTSRCHNEVEHKQRPYWFPEPDEFCFAGDLGISDEEEEDEVELPYLLKKSKINKKKMKDRVWFDPSIPNSHLLLCNSLCFESVYQFREALRDFHIRTLRSFHYHKNSPTRIIVWCSQREHVCEFYMCASRIGHERTFCIKKCNMEHTCPSSPENSKVTTNWLAKAVEPSLRADPRARVDALIENNKVNFLVDVSRSVAYRARRKAIKFVQGDQKEQYYRPRDYLQAIIDTNPGSRCIIKTFEDTENPASTPRFKYMFYCLHASKQGFLNGCRPFVRKFTTVFSSKYLVREKLWYVIWLWMQALMVASSS